MKRNFNFTPPPGSDLRRLLEVSGTDSAVKRIASYLLCLTEELENTANVPVMSVEASVTGEAAPILSITGTGESSIWTWRRWSDGTVEAWGEITVTTAFGEADEASGLFHDTMGIPMNYDGIFTEAPVLSLCCKGRCTASLLNPSESSPGLIYLTSDSGEERDITLYFTAIGK